MTKYEIDDKITGFEGELADIAIGIQNAEETIRQLQQLKACCMDYLGAFENVRYSRCQREKELLYIDGQDKLIGDYTDVIDDSLLGGEYRYAYAEADAAVYAIDREIQNQELIIHECMEQKSRLHQNIADWKRELANAEER